MISLADAALLRRRQQEDSFASVLARTLGPPGEAWERCAARLGMDWERFLLLAITRVPRTDEAMAAVAEAFSLPQSILRQLAAGEVTADEDGP